MHHRIKPTYSCRNIILQKHQHNYYTANKSDHIHDVSTGLALASPALGIGKKYTNIESEN